MRKYKPSEYERDKWSLDEMAEYLQLSHERIRQIIKQYDIPTFKYQRKLYFTPDSADDMLTAYKIGRVNWKLNHELKYIDRLKKQKDRLRNTMSAQREAE